MVNDADKFARHKEAKGETLQVLQRLHFELRCAAADDVELLERSRWLFAVSSEATSERQRFTKWLDGHRTSVLSGERLSSGFEQWIRSHGQSLSITDSSRIGLLTYLINSVTSPTEDATQFRPLLSASFGLVFIRYSAALRQSYYHWLLSDLLPNRTRRDIMETLYVPEGSGTIGWVMKHGLIEARQGTDPGKLAQPVWSCFVDPKGRVATEDLIVGNRSWIGYPIIEDNDPVGVLFCFLPFDGMFVQSSTNDSHGASSPLFCDATFVNTFANIVQQYTRELLLALNVEGTARLYEVSRLRSGTTKDDLGGVVGGHLGGQTDQRRDEWLGQMLFPESAEPGDPLGFQVVINAEEHAMPGSVEPILKITPLIREETFVNQLFRRLQLSCLYPKEWAPHFAFRLQALHNVYHQGWTIPDGDTAPDSQPHFEYRCAIEIKNLTDAIPTWHCRDQEDRPFLSSMNRLSFLYEPAERAAAGKIVSEVYDRLKTTDTGDPHDNYGIEGRRSVDPFRLKDGLDLHSSSDHVLDLVVPLVSKPETCILGDVAKCHGQWCAGFLRLKCFSECAIDNDRLPEMTTRSFRKLYSIFGGSDFAVARAAISDLLTAVEHSFLKKKGLADLKVLLDLRLVLCEAIVRDLTRSIRPATTHAPDDELRLTLALRAARIANVEKAIQDKIETCISSVANFSRLLCQFQKAGDLPEVTLVSLWLTRRRPVLVRHESSGALPAIFWNDPGLVQMLQLFLRWTRQTGTTIEWPIQPPTTPDDGTTPRSAARHFYQQSDASSPLTPTSPLFLPPAFRERSVEGTTEFRYLRCSTDGDQSFADLRCEDEAIHLTWSWDRFPEPVAVTFVQGQITTNLLRLLRTCPNLQLTEKARRNHLEQATTLYSLADILAGGDTAPSGQKTIERLNKVVSFMADDEAPKWRFAGVTIDDMASVLLAYGGLHSERSAVREPKRLARLRETALLGAQVDLSLFLQGDAIHIARRERDRLRWLRHQLFTDFTIARNAVDEIREATDRILSDSSESVSSLSQLLSTLSGSATHARDQYDNLQALLEYLTDKTNQDTPWPTNLETMLERLAVWKGANTRRTVRVTQRAAPVTYPKSFSRLLYMILSNLVNNAVAFARRNGKVNLGFEHLGDGGTVRVFIANSGDSMPQEYQEFLRGERTEPPPKDGRRPEGLLTVRALLKEHHLPPAEPLTPCPDFGDGTLVSLYLPKVVRDRE